MIARIEPSVLIGSSLFDGDVSERPKVQLSKSCVGESPPWVQIPPSPPVLTSDSVVNLSITNGEAHTLRVIHFVGW